MTEGHISQHIVGFVHLLRAMGVSVGTGNLLDFAAALTYVTVTDREALHDAALCTLIAKADDMPIFESAFAFYFRRLSALDVQETTLPVIRVPQRPLRLPRRKTGAGDDNEGDTPDNLEEQKVGATMVYSGSETLRTRDFGSYSHDEVQQARDMMRRMKWRPAMRRTRRTRRDKRRTHYKAEAPTLAKCSTTGTIHLYHRAYYVDGDLYYKGKLVVPAKVSA